MAGVHAESVAGLPQRRKKPCDKQGNDRNNDQQFDQGKSPVAHAVMCGSMRQHSTPLATHCRPAAGVILETVRGLPEDERHDLLQGVVHVSQGLLPGLHSVLIVETPAVFDAWLATPENQAP